MRYIVTGCAGFIGSHLTGQLLKRGDSCVGIDNLEPYYPVEIKLKRLENLKKYEGFEFIEGDITDDQLYERLKGDFDGIFHLAAKAGVRPSLDDPQGYTKTNVYGSIKVFDFARKRNLKVVAASSSSVYGNRTQGPFKETDPTDVQVSPYAASKKAMEIMARGMHEATGLSVILLRYFTVFGPGVRPDLAMSKFIRAIKNEQELTVYGDGSAIRDYTFVRDVVMATMAAMELEGFEIINVGSGRKIKLLDLVQKLSDIIGKKPLLKFVPKPKVDVDLTWADITKAKDLLNYTVTDFEKALKITVRSILNEQSS